MFPSQVNVLPNPVDLPHSALLPWEERYLTAGAAPKFDALWMDAGFQKTLLVSEKVMDTPVAKLVAQETVSKIIAIPTPFHSQFRPIQASRLHRWRGQGWRRPK